MVGFMLENIYIYAVLCSVSDAGSKISSWSSLRHIGKQRSFSLSGSWIDWSDSRGSSSSSSSNVGPTGLSGGRCWWAECGPGRRQRGPGGRGRETSVGNERPGGRRWNSRLWTSAAATGAARDRIVQQIQAEWIC